jgi:hypothetical protein
MLDQATLRPIDPEGELLGRSALHARVLWWLCGAAAADEGLKGGAESPGGPALRHADAAGTERAEHDAGARARPPPRQDTCP